MYPTVVVVLVATRRSVLERSIDQAIQPSTDMRFATNSGARTTTSRASPYHRVDDDRVEIQTISLEDLGPDSSDSDRNADRIGLGQDDKNGVLKGQV